MPGPMPITMSELEESFQDFARLPYQVPVTPYRVALYLFVETCSSETDLNSTERCQLALLLLDLIRLTDLSLITLCEKVKAKCQFSLFERFLEKLNDTTGPEEIVCRSQDIFKPVDPKAFVKKDSLLGLYMRKVIVGYQRLSFTEVSIFHNKWIKYCAHLQELSFEASRIDASVLSNKTGLSLTSPATSVTKFSPVKDRIHQSDFAILTDQSNQSSALSGRQAQRLIARQMHLLQNNPTEALSPATMESVIRKAQQVAPSLYEAYFLSFMNALRENDLSKAERSLHDYFDWSSMPLQYRRESLIFGQIASIPSHLSKSLRYGPLLLCKLCRNFGLKEKALQSLQECIQKSQEAGDPICLQHALAELCTLNVDSETKDISKLLDVALRDPDCNQQLSSSDPLSANLSREVSHSLHHRAQFLQAIAASANLDLSPSQIIDFVERSSVISDSEHSSRVSEAGQALLSSIFLSYGYRESAVQSAQQLLKVNVGDWWCTIKGTEPYCIAMCNIAYAYAMQGCYHKALNTIEHAQSIFPSHVKCSAHWKLCQAILCFDRALLECNFQTAGNYVNVIRCYDEIEADIKNCTLLLQTGRYQVALTDIQKRLSTLNLETNWRLHSRLLLLLACVLTKLGKGGSAQECLNHCATLTASREARNIEAIAQMETAAVELKYGRPKKALGLLDSCKEFIIKQCNLFDFGVWNLRRAKCLLKADEELLDYAAVISLLNEAQKIFIDVNAHLLTKETLYLLAIISNRTNQKNERNLYAAKFKEMEERYPGSCNWLIS